MRVQELSHSRPTRQCRDQLLRQRRSTSPGPPRAVAAPVPPAQRDPEARGKTARRTVSVSQTLSGQRRTRLRRAKGNRLTR